MKAAVVLEAGRTPIYGDFGEPLASPSEHRIAVAAAALSPVVKARASGAHYSSSGGFPFVAGLDGVGRLEDGRRVHFFLPRAPFGSMAESTVAPASQCAPVPDALDSVTAAAIANPAMSSWLALEERAKFSAGETVLVNGATGTSGRLAVQIAKHLGAKKVIATGRNAAHLDAVTALGADETILLVEDKDALETDFKAAFRSGVDVVLDYLWGQSAGCLLIAASKVIAERPLRFVQIGTAGGTTIPLSGATLRSAAIELMGSGLGSVPVDRIVATIARVLRAAVSARLEIATRPIPLNEVERAWSAHANMPRVVFTMNANA